MRSCENDERRTFDFQFDELLFLFQHLQQITNQFPEAMSRFMPSPQSHAESRIGSTCNATSDRTISGMPRPNDPINSMLIQFFFHGHEHQNQEKAKTADHAASSYSKSGCPSGVSHIRVHEQHVCCVIPCVVGCGIVEATAATHFRKHASYMM